MPKAKETPAARAIRLAGGPVAVAGKVDGVHNYQTVQGWARNGVPPKYVLRLEQLSGVSRRELRPKDWQTYWPEPAHA